MNPLQKLVAYLRSAKAEALKVSWPSRQETIRYSSLVIGVSIGLALAFAALDFGYTSLFNATLLAQVEKNHTAGQAQPQPQQPTQPTTEPAKPQIDLDAVDVSGTGASVNVTK